MKKMKVFEHDKHEEREEKNEVKKKWGVGDSLLDITDLHDQTV
jgi:hypothetical protein